ncbi:thiol reductant ABC exporter subunit CydC [Speluncibacter jeojiensis]|uniref:Thiol reductant ABC exporter subunit CydC n=1 Tax=Speluncibacter jeojiensis TaxID=2710754 RepID=A0A9X4M1G0_9ACTN|nr:thiol reductant ABC exporter subunit CydC [Corynebacteriales bacterium D3-21]
MFARDPLWRAVRLLHLPPWRVAAALAAGVGALGSALALAALSAWLITRAWQMPPVLMLSVAVTAVRALGIGRGLFRYLERLASHDTALRGMAAAREQIYRRLADGDPAAVEGIQRGDLSARTGADVDAIGDVVVRALLPIGVAVVLAAAAVGLLAWISPTAALVLAAALVMSGVVAPALSARASAAAERAGVDAASRYSAAAVLALDQAPQLRVAGTLGRVLGRAHGEQDRLVRAVDRAALPAAFATAATPLAMGAAVLGSLMIGIDLYAHTAMTPMALAILVLVPLSAFEAMAVLPDAAVQLTRSRAAARRIMALLDRAGTAVSAAEDGVQPEAPPAIPTTPRLTARELCTGWPDGPATDRPVELDLRPGHRVAVVGPSGAGKTTLLMTLAGLLPPRGGDVLVGDAATTDLSEPDLRARVGFFAEDAHLFDTTVRENLRVARGDAADEQLLDALAQVGLGRWCAELPQGLDTVLTGGAAAVSGGQRRRLLLARALLAPARVLLLDEPTEHLDAAAGAELLQRLLDRRSGLIDPARTVLVVTHQLPARTEADAVIEIGGGAGCVAGDDVPARAGESAAGEVKEKAADEAAEKCVADAMGRA